MNWRTDVLASIFALLLGHSDQWFCFLVGYPFGSVIYDFAGRSVPFVLIAFLVAILGGKWWNCDFQTKNQFQVLITGIQFLAMPPKRECTSLAFSTTTKTLLRDPYILSVIVAVCASTTAMATLEPCLPLWLMETMNPEPWQLGTAFVPDSIGYFIGSSFFGVFALRVGRWKCSLISMLVVGISAICVSIEFTHTDCLYDCITKQVVFYRFPSLQPYGT